MSKKSSTFAPAFEKHGPLAQLNRVPHYGCGGCRFESCTDHKQGKNAKDIFSVFVLYIHSITKFVFNVVFVGEVGTEVRRHLRMGKEFLVFAFDVFA